MEGDTGAEVTLLQTQLNRLAQRDSAAAEAVPIGDDIYLGDYNYIDVQYMTTWAYRVTLGDGRKLVFYLAEDTEGYGYLVQLNDAEYARFADIVDYTYTDDSGVTQSANTAISVTSNNTISLNLKTIQSTEKKQ